MRGASDQRQEPLDRRFVETVDRTARADGPDRVSVIAKQGRGYRGGPGLALAERGRCSDVRDVRDRELESFAVHDGLRARWAGNLFRGLYLWKERLCSSFTTLTGTSNDASYEVRNQTFDRDDGFLYVCDVAKREVFLLEEQTDDLGGARGV